jgi:hypothetical protein
VVSGRGCELAVTCASGMPVMLRIAALCVAAIAAGTAWCEDVLWRNMIGSLPYLKTKHNVKLIAPYKHENKLTAPAPEPRIRLLWRRT